MTNLFLLNDITTNNYKIETLNILSFFSIILSIYVIISINPIISVLYLIGLFGVISTYLNLVGLNFIALSYIIIYVGAVSILFLFILMLISVRWSELQNYNNNSLFLGVMITMIFSYYIIDNTYFSVQDFVQNIFNHKIFIANSNDWTGNLIETNHISNIGNILYTTYNIWLLITSYILLLAMVGCIVITMKPK
jgi:NADH-ubiquinone oxidoreductase chain 6